MLFILACPTIPNVKMRYLARNVHFGTITKGDYVFLNVPTKPVSVVIPGF